MEVYYLVVFFILGTVLGSFFNVVGYRLPLKESIITPPSHCPKCNHKLTMIELIPIFSYLFQKGKCRHCQKKISPFYLVFELVTGILFSIVYLIYGLTPDIIIPLTFISMLIIITISDYNYMIINDSVLLFFTVLLSIEIIIINGPEALVQSFINMVLAFFTMWAIKKLGDFIFKRESMGGGDIKLLGVFGLVLGYPMAILSIFLGSIVGLPIALLTANNKHIIPFGPFLAVGALIIVLTKIDTNVINSFLGF